MGTKINHGGSRRNILNQRDQSGRPQLALNSAITGGQPVGPKFTTTSGANSLDETQLRFLRAPGGHSSNVLPEWDHQPRQRPYHSVTTADGSSHPVTPTHCWGSWPIAVAGVSAPPQRSQGEMTDVETAFAYGDFAAPVAALKAITAPTADGCWVWPDVNHRGYPASGVGSSASITGCWRLRRESRLARTRPTTSVGCLCA